MRRPSEGAFILVLKMQKDLFPTRASPRGREGFLAGRKMSKQQCCPSVTRWNLPVKFSMDKDVGAWYPFEFPTPPGAGPWTAAEEHTDLRNH